MATARYDGIATWYDDEVRTGPASSVTRTAVASAIDLLGPPDGESCLDIGCGTGVSFSPLATAGWQVIGVDVSQDQARVAAARHPDVPVVVADAACLPLADNAVDAAAMILVTTDLEDLAAALEEASRVLRAAGRLAIVAIHPCFTNPWVERTEVPHRHHRGYLTEGWIQSGPGFGEGIRPRVGVNHRTLATLLTAIAAAGFAIERATEPDDDDPPLLLGIAARKLASR